MLVLVVGAAAVLLLSAPALSAPPPWLSQELPALPASGIQHSPAIAVDPADPLHGVVTADDGNPAPPFPRTVTATTANWTTGWSVGGAIQYVGSASAGQADVAWGSAQNVYVVELGSSSSGPQHTLCPTSPGGTAGILFSTSPDGGATYPGNALPIDVGSSTTELVEPAIAVDGNRIYVAYTELKWPTAGCSGTPASSTIFLIYSNDGGASWNSRRRVSPFATSGHYRSPSVASLPDGRAIVAFRDDSSANPQIETETCVSPSPPTGSYCGPGSALVGPSTVVGDATAPALVSSIAGAPTPSVVAAGGRVTVAWHASTGTAVRAFAAMSTDSGATFGPPQQIDPLGAGNQVAPELAATAGGRVDVAYLWDPSGGGIVSATSASAAPPLPGATTEAWGNPVVVQTLGASATTPITGQVAPLGRRLGIATATGVSPLPATVVAFTDTQTSGSQDVHVVGLLHGTSTPVIAPAQTVTASKNISTIVHVGATDDDGDPLTWSTGAQPTTPGSSVTAADPARGEFAFNAADEVGTDTFEAVVTDGVAGHQVGAVVNVNIVNDPPRITCSVLITREDTPLPVDVSDCVSDPNNDPVTMTLSDPVGGGLEHASGTWLFVPALHSTKGGSFVLHASDGDLTADQTVLVTVASTIGKVNLTVKDAGKTLSVASGLALRMKGSAVDATGVATPIFWDFGDHSPAARGTAVSHRFRKPGTFTVKATADQETRQIKVVVRRRAVELVGNPEIVDGVMQLDVRTRAAGKLLVRADSRSQTIKVPAGLTEQILRMQVTTGPLVRLTLRLTPAKAAPTLRVFSLRRLVLISPLSAG